MFIIKCFRADGLPLPGIFIEDSLHMNAQGLRNMEEEMEPADETVLWTRLWCIDETVFASHSCTVE